jgi:hypothetical protein
LQHAVGCIGGTPLVPRQGGGNTLRKYIAFTTIKGYVAYPFIEVRNFALLSRNRAVQKQGNYLLPLFFAFAFFFAAILVINLNLFFAFLK